MKTVLFLCTHNSARSQMAEAFLNHYYSAYYEVKSAGTSPTTINPHVVQVMLEEGIDLSNARSKNLDEYLDRDFDLVVTVCDDAKEACPIFPGDELIHHSFKDPSRFNGSEEEILEQVRLVRNEIKTWILKYFKPNPM